MDGTTRRTTPLDRFHLPLVKVGLYYLGLAIAVMVLRNRAPDLYQVLSSGELPLSGPGETIEAVRKTARIASPGVDISTLTIIGMGATFVLMVPVVWIYTFTRQKRGYQQSLVQTLVILPIVVAAIVILVKNSVALAFSLGGIVGAVSFRSRLDDTKDAIYVFLAIATGLACGVEVIKVGLSLTVFFNAIILLLWYTDFGRVPAQLAAGIGQRRVELARSMAADSGKSGDFVSALDSQILQSMTPDQLQALASRAMKRGRKLSSALYDPSEAPKESRWDGTLRIRAADEVDPAGLRAAVERILDNDVKRWQFVEPDPASGDPFVVAYQVRCRKSVPGPILTETVRRTLLGQAAEISFE